MRNREIAVLVAVNAIIVLTVALMAMAAISLAVSRAHAHEAPSGWKYPWACCSNMDCQQISRHNPEDLGVKITPQGYVIKSTGELVAFQDKRVKASPDGEYHWCAHQAGIDAGHTICLFVPQGAS